VLAIISYLHLKLLRLLSCLDAETFWNENLGSERPFNRATVKVKEKFR